MSCLLAVTTDLPAAKHLRRQPSAGVRPPISSTTMSARELRMSSKSSVQTTDEGTRRAASEVRLRSTLRLKICVSSMPGSFASASTRTTELPTVPNPNRAIFTGEAAETGAGFLAELFGREVLRLVAMSVFDLIGPRPPSVEAFNRFVGEQALHGKSALIGRAAHLVIKEGVIEAGCGGIGCGVSIEDGVAARPVKRSKTHWAGLATGVDHAPGQLKIAERLARRTDGDDLGVSGRVVGRRDQIDPGGKYLAVRSEERRVGKECRS